MTTYYDTSQSPDGWNVTATLTLGDDGRFAYEELWTDYTGAGMGGGAAGRWRRDGGTVVFHAESVEGHMFHPWAAGKELSAVERGRVLDFGGGVTLRAPQGREAAVRNYVRFEPATPSPELAALIRRRVDELPEPDGANFVLRLCKQHGSLPLHCTQIYLWLLRPDGRVLCIDHDTVAQSAEPEEDPVTAYAVLAHGAATYPELGELLPPLPEWGRLCELCGGKGWTEARPPAQYADSCLRCSGLGWYSYGGRR
jgi:hypothetical protein